ncbi:hypothetical protein BLAT2472_50434 [Burkholderia latens]
MRVGHARREATRLRFRFDMHAANDAHSRSGFLNLVVNPGSGGAPNYQTNVFQVIDKKAFLFTYKQNVRLKQVDANLVHIYPCPA